MANALELIKPSDLPAPRQAVIQVLRACAQEDVSNQELAKIVSIDLQLTAEILRIVNSPFFGVSGEVSSIVRAINMLGHRALKNMVLCISVKDLLEPDSVAGFDVTAFWEDTLRRATAGRLLADIAGLNKDDCFTACILQDFGLLVMFYVMREVKADWSVFIKQDPQKRLHLEQQSFGITHDTVSALLARTWSLPEQFIEAIEHHHEDPESDKPQVADKLTQVMHCADWIAALFSTNGKANILQSVYGKLAEHFSMSEEQGVELLNRMPSMVEEAASALGLHLQEQTDFEEVLRETNLRLADENLSYQELTWQLEEALHERDELAASLRNELELAAEIQRSLLPGVQSDKFPLYGVNIPASELSGDFFDYFELDDGNVFFNLGDVSGKGVTASLLMAKTSSLFHCLGKTERDLGKLMSQINREICETSVRGMFVAMVAGRYHKDSGEVVLINAGNPPILFVQEGHVIRKIEAASPPLGVIADAEFPVVRFNLGTGHLFMYSDGVTEGYIADKKEYGMQGLIATIEANIDQSPRQQVDAILEKFVHSDVKQRDDITIMILDGYGQTFESLGKYEFTAEPAELQDMRQEVRTVLENIGCNKTCIDRLILAVNEAAMNVIQHAYGDDSGHIHIEILRSEDNLLFRLTDFACPIDQSCVKARDLNDVRPGGLGVHFMQEIMDDIRFQEDCENAGNILLMRKKLDDSCLKKKGE